MATDDELVTEESDDVAQPAVKGCSVKNMGTCFFHNQSRKKQGQKALPLI